MHDSAQGVERRWVEATDTDTSYLAYVAHSNVDISSLGGWRPRRRRRRQRRRRGGGSWSAVRTGISPSSVEDEETLQSVLGGGSGGGNGSKQTFVELGPSRRNHAGVFHKFGPMAEV